MKYLFFDLEFATSRYGISIICEFGYVLTNDRFRLVERGNFIINPAIKRREWDWAVVSKILTRKVSEYENAPDFPEFYPKIKRLFKKADRVIGHSTIFDAKALNCDIYRYGLEPINFEFSDISVIYRRLYQSDHVVSLSNMLKAMDIEGETNTHDAEADAYNTMLALRHMVKETGVTLDKFMKVYPDAVDATKDFNLRSFVAKKEKKLPSPVAYIRYIKTLKPDGSGISRFYNKTVCISRNYQLTHMKNLVNLATRIINEDGKVTLRSSYCDIYVTFNPAYNGSHLDSDKQLENVKLENENGKKIEIIDIPELLKRLGLTKDELDALPPIKYGGIKPDKDWKPRRAYKNFNENKENSDSPTDSADD